MVKHMRDVHNSREHPIDERIKYRVEIKEIIRECYPAYFVDSPIPTVADIEELYVPVFLLKFLKLSKLPLCFYP